MKIIKLLFIFGLFWLQHKMYKYLNDVELNFRCEKCANMVDLDCLQKILNKNNKITIKSTFVYTQRIQNVYNITVRK